METLGHVRVLSGKRLMSDHKNYLWNIRRLTLAAKFIRNELAHLILITGCRSMPPVISLLIEECLCPSTCMLRVIILLEAMSIWIVVFKEWH